MTIFQGNKILICVAHPDDELLGLGATVYQLVHQHQCEVKVVILGEGITSRADQRDRAQWEKELETHRSNIYAAQKMLGYQQLSLYDFPDNRFDTIALLDIIKVVEKEKTLFNPDIIFTHHGGDLNIDHQLTFQAVITATRPMENENVKAIITFETPSGTEWQAPSDPRKFSPNLFIEISEEALEAKIKAMECYEFERRKFPHPRSAEALKIKAQICGINVGRNFIEGFQIVKIIY
jgi:LmbE family N-acetylglucosaminyl deacetylase